MALHPDWERLHAQVYCTLPLWTVTRMSSST